MSGLKTEGIGAKLVLAVAIQIAVTATLSASTPVADAASRGDIEQVRALLREGADVNAAHGDGMTPLHWAADRGDAPLAKLLLYAGASTEAGTRIGRYTPLHIAARSGQLEVVRILLAGGADAAAVTTNSGVTPLHLAAASGRSGVVAALLQAGADVNVREGSWGQTPLVFAAASNRGEVVRVLLEAGADPSVTSRWVDAAEREEADRAAERRITEILADFKEKEGGGTDWKPTPSQVQAAIEASREIQKNWKQLKAAEEKKRTEARKAAEGGSADTASASEPEADKPKIFNAEGQPVDVPTSPEDQQRARPLSYGQTVGGWGGLTPLLHAVRQGHGEAALALLDGGADIDQPSAGDRTTPLLMAAVNGQFDLALTLLERGADPNLASDAGTTPLFAVLERTWAPRASYSHPTEQRRQKATYLEVMEALLEAGADPNVRLEKHLWYMEYTFGVLRQSGINLKGATPFWRAAHALDVDAMSLLKEYGADPDIATIKPPQRRRRGPMPSEEAEPKAADDDKQKAKAQQDEAVAESGKQPPQDPAKANAEGESADEQKVRAEESEKEEDPSGVPPVPVGGPAIYPIHAASGVGYGQSFAGNAHRYVPDNWLAAVRFLVEECGADVNLRDHNAYTPLHHAASRGDNELILYLVEKGADVTVVSRKGQTTADMANGPIQRVPPYPETIQLLEKLGSKNNNNCVSC